MSSRQSAPQFRAYSHPLVMHKLTLMRDRLCSSEKFRRLMREIGMFLAFEATRDYPLEVTEVEAPAADKGEPIRPTSGMVLHGKKMAVVPIIRSGLVLAEGIMEVIPTAKIGHIGLSRVEDSYTDVIEYFVSLPDPSNRDFILADPVIGTGSVASQAIKILKGAGVKSKNIRFVTVLASPQGLEKLANEHPDVQVFPVNIEDGLDKHHHIQPGFGESSDRLFGTE